MSMKPKLHAIDPRDEMRECPNDSCFEGLINLDEWVKCLDCAGRGYIVGRLKWARREIHFVPSRDQRVVEVKEHEGCWFAYMTGDQFPLAGTTEAEALLAARCAALGVEILLLDHDGGWAWFPTGKRSLFVGGFDTPDSALLAALEARER